jgi:hypothetical protein
MKKTIIEKVIGYLLITPGTLSILAFFYEIINGHILEHGRCESSLGKWFFNYKGIDNITTNHMPIYLGLMAIAGVYLIKDKKE